MKRLLPLTIHCGLAPSAVPARSGGLVFVLAILVNVLTMGCTSARADEPPKAEFSAEQLEFFEAKIRPLLAEHCYACHSDKAEKLKGGLKLDRRDRLLQGGDSGRAVVPGKPNESPLIAAVRWQSFEMPPRGKLKPAEIAALERWVEMGAPWPPEKASTVPPSSNPPAGEYDWNKWRREHWAFQPITSPTLPLAQPSNWVQTPVDRFVLARLEQEQLAPSPPASARVLVRRLYFDLHGVPPTPDEMAHWEPALTANRQLALPALVDALLASPRYGQRWARHWLDVARYSDGFGGFLDNAAYADAWRYRDWVVSALNSDLPVDTFLREQIAGDLTNDHSSAIATGFFALGPNYISDGGDPDSIAQARAETLSDRLDTLGQGMLGLTLACARCHDHKFDPIPQRDYYALAGVFNNSGIHELPLAADSEVKEYRQQQQAIAERKQKIDERRKAIQDAKREPTPDEQRQLTDDETQLAELKKTARPKYDTAHVLHDTGSADMTVAIRGNLRAPGPVAPRRFPQILGGDQQPVFTDGSGRKQLAAAVVDPSNPLTARVLANRVWMHHLGEALVRTPNNFGALGERPTHPELLDWLATYLWETRSFKQLHRQILLSSTFQMASEVRADAFARDGDNRFVWRMNPRRLDAESWRDALLSVTGELDASLGGRPTDRVDSRRRTLYFKVSRNGDVFATDEFLRLFDFPLMRASVARRPTSIVPQQFLFLLNSPFMVERARAVVRRLSQEAADDESRIRRAYELLYQRPVTAEELDFGLRFVRGTTPANEALSAWEQYAQVLLGANEFMYVQ